MILGKEIEVRVGRRNLSLVRKYYPNAKDNEFIKIPQKLCLEIAKCNLLECVCDKCGKEYKQSGDRIVETPMREFLCGNCMFLYGQENMINTMRSDKKRKEQSEKLLKFCNTDIGKKLRKESGKKHSEYLKSRLDLLEIYKTHLPRMYGENHPNFNPNKTEYQKYLKEVKNITETNYIKNLEIINPNGYVRTLCGVEGGYQLDHIISIKQGFDEGISPEIIGGLNNLQMLPWKDNRDKWHK